VVRQAAVGEPPRPKAEEIPETNEQVSGEILVSRSLCGLIDLTLAAVVAGGFGVVAAGLAQFDFFSRVSLLGTGILMLVLVVVNSLYFLITCGQTPGMAAARLRLVTESGDPPGASPVILRSILFLPSLASVVGLGWAVLDSERRCAHDVLSGTRVVDAEEM
jgi:uncharacterized RDD family membrane protein YckC